MLKTIDGRYGPVTFFQKDMYVGRSLWHYGEYGPDESEMVVSLAKEGDGPCLDIGANIGCISQALESAGFPVVAFEPQPEVASVLRKNIKGTVHNVGLGREFGVGVMPKVYYGEKNNIGGLGIGFTSIYGSYEVPIEPLDSYCLDVGFIKMDVEGFELEVLHGAVETIKRCRPVMYIEDDRPANSAELRKFITSLEYTIEDHKPTLYREQNYFGLKRNVWDRNYASHNLICRPC